MLFYIELRSFVEVTVEAVAARGWRARRPASKLLEL